LYRKTRVGGESSLIRQEEASTSTSKKQTRINWSLAIEETHCIMVDYTTCNKNGFYSVIRTPGRRRNVIAFAGVCVLCFVIIMSVLGATGVFKNESAPAEVNGLTGSDGDATVRRQLPMCMKCVARFRFVN
jgi:hypothetical protein